MLKDDILISLQAYGKLTAREIAEKLNRSEKNVMRELAEMLSDGLVQCEQVNIIRYLKLKHWSIKSERTRMYCLPLPKAKDECVNWLISGGMWTKPPKNRKNKR